MTDIKKSNQTSGSVNPVVAGMAGAVVAGVAVAGAMAMANKDNQDKVNDVVSNVKADIENKKSIVDKAAKLGGIAKNAVNEVKNI
jgi:hypothetical protein